MSKVVSSKASTVAQRAQFWQRHVDQLNGSGLTVAQYAGQHGVNVHTLKGWRSELGRRAAQPAIPVGAPAPLASPFVAVRVSQAAPPTPIAAAKPSGAIALSLGNGVRLELTQLPEVSWLAALSHSLSAVR